MYIINILLIYYTLLTLKNYNTEKPLIISKVIKSTNKIHNNVEQKRK